MQLEQTLCTKLTESYLLANIDVSWTRVVSFHFYRVSITCIGMCVQYRVLRHNRESEGRYVTCQGSLP